MTEDHSHVSHVFSWRKALFVLPAFIIGLLIGSSLGFGLACIYTAVVASLTVLTGSAGSLRSATQIATPVGLGMVALTSLSSLTAGNIALSAVAMAAVAFLTSVLSSAKPVGLLFALVGTFFYLFSALFSTVLVIDQKVVPLIVIHAAVVGVIWGLLSIFVRTSLSRQTAVEISDAPPAHLFSTIRIALKEFRRGPRDGIRRGLALGIAMAWFQAVPAHDSAWLLLTIAVFLPVDGRAPLLMSGYRLFGTFLALGVALTSTLILPSWTILLLGLGAGVYGVVVAARSTTQATAALFMMFLLLIGAPGPDVGIYAGLRLVDTAIGTVIALTLGYLLWPKQPLTVIPVDPDLIEQTTRLRLS